MISYLTQVTICWGLFYLLYAFWLRKETFFKANRWYLLSTLIAGLVIPLLELPILAPLSANEILSPANYLETITVTAQAIENNLVEIVITPVQENWSLQFILTSIYWLGVLFFASRFLYGMFQILRLTHQGKIIKKRDYFLVQTNQAHLPFSFLDYLFWSNEIKFSQEDHTKILRHELSHIKGKHSIDVLIVEILSIFLWCSPFIFLYKKALKNIHEYLADDAVLQDTPTKKYGQLLLKQSQSGLQIAQANHFIHSQLKNRIIMMTKTKSQRHALLKYTAIIPLALFLVFSISAKTTLTPFSQTQSEPALIKKDTSPVTTPNPSDLGDFFQVVEEMPRFKGCEDLPANERKSCADKKMLEHVYKNIKYPAAARKAGIQGTVVVRFIIEKDGRISNVEPIRKIGKGCDEEVVRIVKAMPDFIPGKQRGKNVRVQYNLPVKFKLEGDDVANNKLKLTDVVEVESGNKPYIVVDGKAVTSMDHINPDDIETINVLKGKAAFEKYGENGKNGVIEVKTTKNPVTVVGYGIEKDKEPLRVAEQMPLFPATTDKKTSNQALLTFIYENLKYPKAAKDENIEGTVVANFIITKAGTISSPRILRSIGGGTDEEVLRVIELMNELPQKWTPAVQGGKKVNLIFNLPIKFKLQSDSPKEDLKDKIDPATKPEKAELFSKVDIYPNPSSGNLNLHLYSDKNSPTTVTIHDQKGTQLYRKEFTDQEIKISDLDLQHAANGIILISFEKDGEIITREVVLQK